MDTIDLGRGREPDMITCYTPEDSAGPVDVTVTNTDEQEATLYGQFQYNDPASGAAPTINTIHRPRVHRTEELRLR